MSMWVVIQAGGHKAHAQATAWRWRSGWRGSAGPVLLQRFAQRPMLLGGAVSAQAAVVLAQQQQTRMGSGQSGIQRQCLTEMPFCFVQPAQPIAGLSQTQPLRRSGRQRQACCNARQASV